MLQLLDSGLLTSAARLQTNFFLQLEKHVPIFPTESWGERGAKGTSEGEQEHLSTPSGYFYSGHEEAGLVISEIKTSDSSRSLRRAQSCWLGTTGSFPSSDLHQLTESA